MKQLIFAIFACVLIIGGIFAGVRTYNLATAQSYINGSINISNEFEVENLSYSITNLVFYEDLYSSTKPYYFDITLQKVTDFNGLENDYQVILNNYVVFDTETSAGLIDSSFYVDFYNTEGIQIHSSKLDIEIEFLSDQTNLSFTTQSAEDEAFLTQYFEDNGLKLEIKEI